MKRTKSAYPEYYQAWGGCMAFPPHDCVRHDKVFGTKEGIPWICNAICLAACGDHPCERRKQYKATNEWQNEAERLSAIRKAARSED